METDVSMEASSRTDTDGPREEDGLVQTRWASQDGNQPSAASLDSSVNGPPGLLPENSAMFCTALSLGLPRHLLLRAFQTRSRTCSSPYFSLRELVSDLFRPQAEDQEVPMMTEQLEEGLMLSCYTVRKALRLGAPLHLIKPLVRARILSTGTGYTHTSQLINDINKLCE